MKDKKKLVEDEVRKTMQSLDGIEKAKTDDFFYSRMQEKIDRREVSESLFGFELSLVTAAVFLFLILNSFVVFKYYQTYEYNEVTKEEYLEAFSEEYQAQFIASYNIYTEE